MAMAPGDLVTLRDLKRWLGNDKTNSDDLLRRLIRSASAFVLNYCNRNVGFGWRQVTTVADGNGLDFMLLREAPVTDIVSIDLGTGTILTTPSTGSPPSPGFTIPDDSGGQFKVVLIGGYYFPRGRSNITFTYHAGFKITGEAQTVPATLPPNGAFELTAFLGWIGDLGVTLANGTPLTPVPAGTAPGAMQYAVDDGVYTFNVAQAGAAMLLSYQQCPDDVQQAVLELAGERSKVTAHIGEVSHAMGGQTNTTTTFSQHDLSDFAKTALRPYRKVTPA